MPIYAYKCSACGHAKDALQKMSDAPLTVCPACGASAFRKQVTAAGFQLKGSGWYVTDFRDGSPPKGRAVGRRAAERHPQVRRTAASPDAAPSPAPAPAPAAPAGTAPAPKSGD
jgi:putative FmdB family regulatory protein